MRTSTFSRPMIGLLTLSMSAFGACGDDTGSAGAGTSGSGASQSSAGAETGSGTTTPGTTMTPDTSGNGGTEPSTPIDDTSGPTPPQDTSPPAPSPDAAVDDASGPTPGEDTSGPARTEDAGTTEPAEDTSATQPEVAQPVEPCGDGVCEPTEGCEACPEDCPVCGPQAGELLITEIMQNPKALEDAVAEWIEIQNIGSVAIELSGVTLRDDADDFHVITPETSLSVSPGDYVILAASWDIGSGAEPDYVWSDFFLSNGDDQIIIEHAGGLIDAVAYDDGATFPDPKGASMSLSPETTTTADNDLGQNWCEGQAAMTSGDFGSPGADNPTCIVCGDGTCDASEACETCPDDCGSCTPCDAGAEASDEVCNGIDDDCDGSVDEGVDCDDGIACTDDTCDGAAGCAYEPTAATCIINDTCYGAGEANPSDPCQACNPSESLSSWTSATNKCLIDDVCYSDGDANPSESCQACDPSVSTSGWSAAQNKCLIDGVCYSDGDANPNNTCQVCDPGTASDNWASTLLSFDCENEDPCTENGTCVAGFCIGSSEVDPDNYDESASNDTKETASILGSITDDTDFPAGTVTGSLWKEGDVDWYTYFDEDNPTNLAFFIPTVELTTPIGSDYRLCTFFTCENGEEPNVTNCEGGVKWDAEEGLFGCCDSGSEFLSIKMSVQCTWQGALADSGDVHVRIDNLSDDYTCGEYTLNWGDD